MGVSIDLAIGLFQLPRDLANVYSKFLADGVLHTKNEVKIRNTFDR